MKFSIEQLKAIGMDDDQVRAIMNAYGNDDNAAGQQVNTENGEWPLVATVPHKLGNHKSEEYCLGDVPKVEDLKITSISDLHIYGKGQKVRLPDFAEGQPFVARLRRPSMLVLAKEGKIPNTLMASANALFNDGGKGLDADDPNMLKDIFDVCVVIAKAALVEPTYEDIKNAGMELSDNQLMAIFSYTQTGVKALDSFR